jgi:hypothetical protein
MRYDGPSTLVNGITYKAGVWLRSTYSGSVDVDFRAGSTVSRVTTTLDTNWQFVESPAITANGTTARIEISSGSIPDGNFVYVDGAIFETASTYDGSFFDGNFVGDIGPGYVYGWTGTTNLSSSTKSVLVPDPTGYYVIGNNHGDNLHLCMSEINVFSDADAVYNSLTVSLTSDPATFVTRKDQDSIDLYGESAIDIAINTTTLAQLDNWADRVFNHKSANQVNMVQTPAIDRLGTLTEAAVFTPGMTVGVSYTKDQLNIVGFYTIIKVSHRIDVDNWFTTLELWKEA